MKVKCSQCIQGKLISGQVCGRCNGTGEIEKVKKAKLEIDLAKYLTFEEGHGFVLHDCNDSVYFDSDEAIKIAQFIADYHNSQAIVMVKSVQ